MVEDVIQQTEVEDEDWDDSDVPIKTLIRSVVGSELPAGVAARSGGVLMSIRAAESMAETPVDGHLSPTLAVPQVEETLDKGRGKRKKFKNVLYREGFWWHNDDEASDVEDREG